MSTTVKVVIERDSGRGGCWKFGVGRLEGQVGGVLLDWYTDDQLLFIVQCIEQARSGGQNVKAEVSV